MGGLAEIRAMEAVDAHNTDVKGLLVADLYYFDESLDPDPHQGEKRDPDPHYCILDPLHCLKCLRWLCWNSGGCFPLPTGHRQDQTAEPVSLELDIDPL